LADSQGHRLRPRLRAAGGRLDRRFERRHLASAAHPPRPPLPGAVRRGDPPWGGDPGDRGRHDHRRPL